MRKETAAGLSEIAQRVFSDPGKASDEDIASAAGELNTAIEAAELSLQTARQRRERESLDLYARGDIDGVAALMENELAADTHLQLLRHAVESANKRLDRGEREKEQARISAIFDRIRADTVEREGAIRDLAKHGKLAAKAYVKASVLGAKIWGELPVTIGLDVGQIEMMTDQTLEEGLNRVLGFHTKGLYSTGAGDRNPDILTSCKRGHAVILAAAPRAANRGPHVVVSAEEFERRQRASGKPRPDLSMSSELTDKGWDVPGGGRRPTTKVTAEEFEARTKAAKKRADAA